MADVVFTCFGDFVSWAPKKSSTSTIKKNYRRNILPIPKKARGKETFRRRRITRLLRLTGRLKKRPCRFLTLVFDRKGNRDWPLEKCQKAFAVFRRWLEYNFPDCWFIFVMEWTRKCGIHYHLTGRFGKKDIPKDVIREKWMKITGSTWSKSIKFLPSLPHLRGYLTTSKKAADTRHLMKELQGKSFWGCIHRKKIPLVPTKRLTFTDDGAFIYKLSLAFQIIIEGGSKNDIRRIFKKNGSLAFTTPEMRKKSLQFAQVYMEVMS